MLPRRCGAPRSALLLLLLSGCADDIGTYCRYDYQCVSNSCTWSSCDGPLGAAIARAGKSPAEEEPEEPTPPSPTRTPERKPDCPWLCEVLMSEYQCNQAAGCHVEWECAKPLPCTSSDCFFASCGAMDADSCQAPCVRQVRCVGKREC